VEPAGASVCPGRACPDPSTSIDPHAVDRRSRADCLPPTIPRAGTEQQDVVRPDRQPGEDQESTAVRTIKLCASPTRRPTTLLGAIARSVSELERTGRASRPVRLPVVRGALA